MVHFFVVAWLFVGGSAWAKEPGIVLSVLYFDNQTQDPALEPLGKGLADMMTTDFARVEGLTVVERSRLQDVIGELDLQQSAYFDPANAQKIGALLGATHAALGAFTEYSPDLRIDIRLVNVKTGKVEMADQVTGPKNQFFQLQSALSNKFVNALLKRAQPVVLRDFVQDADWLVGLGQGLDLMDQGNLTEAQASFQRLSKAYPQFARARVAEAKLEAMLVEARAARLDVMSEIQRELLTAADKKLVGDVPCGDEPAATEWLGYRVARSVVFVKAAESLTAKHPSHPAWVLVPEKSRDRYLEQVRKYVANARLQNEEYRACRKRGVNVVFARMEDEDERRRKLIERSSRLPSIGRSVASVGNATDLALIVCRNSPVPTVADLDPALAREVLGLILDTMKDPWVVEDEKDVGDDGALVQFAASQCELALGEKDKAVERIQRALQTYPLSTYTSVLETHLGLALNPPVMPPLQ